MTINLHKGEIMSTLDVKKNVRHDFNSPKKLYHIEFYNDKYPIVELVNCYGVYKRQKDLLIKRKRELGTVGGKKVKTQKIWQKYKPNLIFDDLNFAKKMAIIEFKKWRLEKLNRQIEKSKNNIENTKREIENVENSSLHIVDVKYNDSNKDIFSISLF
jgi:hypothetical protein